MKKLINHPENVVVEGMRGMAVAHADHHADPGCASSVLLLESLREAARSAT